MFYKPTFRLALLAATLFAGALSAAAQDKIYLDDGSIIDAKVKEISARKVVYRRWDNQDGADYVVTRWEVSRIVYQNGTEEKLSARNERPSPFNRDRNPASGNAGTDAKRRGTGDGYGNNILAIAPMQMTNESVAGVGIHYERIIDKAGIFAIYIPVAFAFYDDEAYIYSPTGLSLKTSRVFTYLYPGIKLYPGGSNRRVSYSVGPSFGLGFGTKYQEQRTFVPGQGTIITGYKDASVFKAGFMVNNGLNIQPTRSLYVGLEFGIGIQYYNNEYSDYTIGGEPMVQFNFKMGYRF